MEDSILNALRCDLKGIEMESKILDSARKKKNTAEVKFQHYQINKQIHAESTLLRVFRVLCGELMTAVMAFILVAIELNDHNLRRWRDLFDYLLFNTTLL